MKINSSGEYSGIGAETRYFDKKLVISEVYESYSAEEEGLRVGDQIVGIDDVIVADSESDQISTLLKGVPGSTVKLRIKRQNKEFDLAIKREKIMVDPVPHFQMVSPDIGYIAFNKFNNKASSSVKSAFVELKEDGMTKLILDLRGNPGGLLNEAINITNFFVPKHEVVVSTKAKLKKWSEVYRTKYEPIDTEIPLVVLIDGRSASAAEIVAGSLQDLDRAVILGERSFGKGLVQRYRNLTYGTKLKLTISKYYTPSGRNIQELDYTHRKGEDVPKFAKENRNSFKTKNGRTVYDGGGISPDIEVSKQELSESTKALLKSDAIFNFATDYFYKNPTITSPETYVFEEAQYDDFISYILKESSTFQTLSEKKFEDAFEISQDENLSEGIKSSYQKLSSQIQDQKIKELNKNKEKIMGALSDEIINRYYFKKGEYQNDIEFSPFIKEAISVLENQDQYRSILLNGKN